MAYVRELFAIAALGLFVCGLGAVGILVVEDSDVSRATVMAEAN